MATHKLITFCFVRRLQGLLKKLLLSCQIVDRIRHASALYVLRPHFCYDIPKPARVDSPSGPTSDIDSCVKGQEMSSPVLCFQDGVVG